MGKQEDQLFAKMAIENYFIQKKQAIECVEILKNLDKEGKPLPSLSELLIEKGYLTLLQKNTILRMITAQQSPVVVATSSEKSAEVFEGKTKKSDDPLPKGKAKAVEPAFQAKELAGYQLLEPLGEGKMGIVYKARQISMDRWVAVKILAPHLAKDEEFRKRFLSEARATARLNHSNIVAGIDVGVAEGQYYFVMEYIDGPSLHKKLERGGAFDEKMSLSIILQIAKALEHAAKHQMVHRDIKPDNIMITKSGIAKLCDLGLALHSTQTNFEEGGRALGTPYYISPEQALGKGEVDIRSDLYSLGATLFHLLTGKPPFQGSPAVVMTKHINEKAPSLLEKLPSLKKETALLVQKLLEKNPKDRYQTPKELIEDLEKILESRNMVLTKASSPPISQTPKLKEVSRTQKVNAPKATLPEKATEETPPPRSKANALRAMRKRRSRF